jgi:hypothetical protein
VAWPTGRKKFKRKWQAAPIMGWDELCFFRQKIMVSGAGAGKEFFACENGPFTA